MALKQPGEPVELDRLAFALCHASMRRRLLFALQEQLAAQSNPYSQAFEIGVGYGASRSCAAHFPDADLVIDYDVPTGHEAGARWIIAQLAALGVEVEARA